MTPLQFEPSETEGLQKKIARLKELIAREVFVKNSQQQIDTFVDPDAWLFDFRRVLMKGEVSNLISEIFFALYKDRYPFQLGTIEIAGVPLVTSLMNKLYTRGFLDANAFFIRKSRKKTGLLQMVEGEVKPGLPVILVDDILNSGNSFWKQIEVLEALGHRVDTVWSILRFQDEANYQRFYNRGIRVQSLFELNDFTSILGPKVRNISLRPTHSITMPFERKWLFQSGKPSLNYVLPKSQPCLDQDTVYVGSDHQMFWAINQVDGQVKWSFKVGSPAKLKSIFSSPVLAGKLVIFGAYDGNVYALDKVTGKKVWVSFEADWIGSSPALAPELGLVFIGLEFGLWRRHGGIAALEITTGKTIWSDRSHQALTHASPLYISSREQVVIGSNEGRVRLYEARTGKLVWTFITFGGAEYSSSTDAGFGNGEIKQGIVYDERHEYLIFGATDGFLYVLDCVTGHLVFHFKCEFAVWGTPYLDAQNARLYFTALDKKARCLCLDTLTLVWEKELDGTRIFSTPTIIEKRLYIGTNSGRLHELDPITGESLGYFQATERITNTVLYNPETKSYFLPTSANEIVCLTRSSGKNS